MAMPSNADVWVELDYAGIGQVLRGSDVADVVTKAANKAAAAARSGAPNSKYAESIKVETHDSGQRTWGYVIAPFGAKTEAESGVLARALGSATV